jgi:hypothetical protein
VLAAVRDTFRVSSDGQRQLRVGNAEREATLERLRDAHAEGRLDIDEFYARLDTVYDAKTYGELDAVVADLPAAGLTRLSSPPAGRAATKPPSPDPPARPAPAELTAAGALAAMPAPLRAAWVTWATAVSINFVIWALISILGRDFIYPWPLWVAGPWGVINLGMTATWWLNRKQPPEAQQLPPGS